MEVLLPVGDPRRMSAGRAVLGSVAVMGSYLAFAFVTTQDRAVRTQTPWQDDPYDGLVTLTMACVPVVLAMVLARALLWRRAVPLPVVRARGILRASAFGVTLVLATATVDLVAPVVGARRTDWGWGTPWLVGLATVLGVACGVVLVAGRRASRRLPRSGPDDWSADLARLGRPGRWAEQRLFAGNFGVRRHPVAWSVAAAQVGAAVLVAGLWLGEGTPLWLIGPLGALVCGSGFVLVVALANRVLGLARVARGRPVLRSTWLGAALGLDLAFTLRDQLWSALGPGVPTLTDIYLVMAAGGLAGGAAAYLWTVRRRGATAWTGPSSSRR